MNVIWLILVLLAGVIFTHWITKALGGRVAMPLVQIALGSLIGATTDLGITLEPELFFVLFLPPLLFLDGWRVPKKDLQDNGVTILSLAFGLVFFTVLGVGLMVHLLIPTMPLAVCFALAAVLSPTDVVAATAMMANVSVPARLQRILEGEALFNDASGLVCLRLAVTVVLTGSFPFWTSVGGLVWAAVGGIAVGLALSWVISKVKFWIVGQIGEDTSAQIVISLLTPYSAYLLAELVGGSAVLSAVAAGLMMSWIEVSGRVMAVTRIYRNAVWQTLQYTLNGSIFLLLGEQLPNILSRINSSAAESGHPGLGWLAVYVLAVSVALAVLRFGWVWVSVVIWLRRHKAAAAGHVWPNWRLVTAMSVAGVRGAITLAGALSLPLLLPDGSPFPSRDLAILIAAGCILVSLVSANLTLPGLLHGVTMPPEPHSDQQERNARVEATKAAIAALASATTPKNEADGGYLAALTSITAYYQHRLRQLEPQGAAMPEVPAVAHDEERLHVLALRAERAAIVKMARGHRISTDLAHKLLRETDLAETAFQAAAEG